MRYFDVRLSRGDAELAHGNVQAESEEAARAMLPTTPGLHLVDVSHKLRPAREVEHWTSGWALIRDMREAQGIPQPPEAYAIDGYRNTGDGAVIG